ncbi:MAG: leucine-rich repeat domain-containing protein [Lachnospiraceae bacterium]|nr:leucine-rich repeat domain-containing protein [Lachnospiraceae bacterium]
MKRVKKFIASLLVLALTLGTMSGVSLNPAVVHAGETADFTYEINGDGTITITKARQAWEKPSQESSEDVVIPHEIEGREVTRIGNNAFEGIQAPITNIYLPDTITYFGERAFASSSIQNIYSYEVLEEDGEVTTGSALQAFPASLTTIETHCFDNSKLEEINLPVSIKTIGEGAFFNIPAKEFEIPEDAEVEYLGAKLFNSPLETITIKGRVSEIADNAFAAISTLETVTLEQTGWIGTIGARCFENSGSQKYGFNLNFYGRVDVLGNNAMQGSGGITEFYMEDVGVIGNEAFMNCSIQTVTLKGAITSIGERAFMGCGSIDIVTVESTTTYTIGKYAFYCSSIREVVFSDGLKVVQEGTFSGCGHLEEVYLPSTLEEIEENAFENVSTIKTITINENAVVDENAFRGAGGSTLEALDRVDNASVKKIVDKALNRNTTPSKSKAVKVKKAKLKQAKCNKKKTKVTLKWSKSSNATGYIIYVKVVKKGKKASKVKWKKVKTIKKKKTTKLTLKLSKSRKKVLKKKGKIYYRICAYKKVKQNGKTKTYKSAYSQKKLK